MLPALTQPKYPKAAIGIERDRLTMLSIQREGRGQFSLKQAASVDVPPGLIEPSFLEKNIRNQTELLYLLEEAATLIAETSGVRAVMIAGNGPNFTLGGDVNLFAGTPREQLPHRLRRMIDGYHQAIERLTSIDAPVVAAVRGAAAGGGLGLLYVADIVIAADDARFALGYGALGLTSDGGNTWFLPRMVGMRRAQELFLLNRRLTAREALEFGLISRLVPSDAVEGEAAAVAANLAAGPTRAYGAMRRMLRQSFETGLGDHHGLPNLVRPAAAAVAPAQECGVDEDLVRTDPQLIGGAQKPELR